MRGIESDLHCSSGLFGLWGNSAICRVLNVKVSYTNMLWIFVSGFCKVRLWLRRRFKQHYLWIPPIVNSYIKSWTGPQRADKASNRRLRLHWAEASPTHSCRVCSSFPSEYSFRAREIGSTNLGLPPLPIMFPVHEWLLVCEVEEEAGSWGDEANRTW